MRNEEKLRQLDLRKSILSIVGEGYILFGKFNFWYGVGGHEEERSIQGEEADTERCGAGFECHGVFRYPHLPALIRTRSAYRAQTSHITITITTKSDYRLTFLKRTPCMDINGLNQSTLFSS